MKPHQQVSRDANRRLEEFSDEFASALALADFETWAETLGYVRTTDALTTTFPIPISAAGYHVFKGDMKYRSLFHRSMQMTSRQWQDGVEELVIKIEKDLIDWAGEPARMAHEWKRQPNLMVADLLAESSLAGPLLDFYRDPETKTASARRLFAADHPYNVLKPSIGTFDNRLTCTLAEIESGVVFDNLNAHFRGIKGPNGKPLGLRMQGGNLLCPADLENIFKNTLQFDTIVREIKNVAGTENVGGVTRNNIYKGTVGYTVADELADQTHFYAFASGKPGLFPFVVQLGGPPLELILDKDSEKYKETLKVSISYVGDAEAAACLPHGIVRVEVTDA